jgi:hypothetical protein
MANRWRGDLREMAHRSDGGPSETAMEQVWIEEFLRGSNWALSQSYEDISLAAAHLMNALSKPR